MKFLKNAVLIISIFFIFSSKVFADTVWINDIKTLFLSNQCIIYAINIRTFNADDKNRNGIIEENLGEERGTFLNAIDRLDELSAMGVNTVNLLPVTSLGKVKALGTAGSLYAVSSFNELNPQLKSPGSKLTIEDEMRKFVEECHKRNIRVVVDLPCCASYDLYLKKPELFVKDKNQKPIIPGDWTDVRLLNAGTESKINPDVYNLYSEFIDLMINMNADGVKVNVPSIKPAAFWKKLIEDTRMRNPQFLFLAEVSSQNIPLISEHAPSTSFNKLMDAGFDGYYGNYSNLKNWKTPSELISQVKFDLELAKKFSNNKSVIGNFATQDQISPILVNGAQFSKMIIWLNTTLPLNSYYIDGFATGDDYIYFWANKKAPETFTDDDYYFVHRGQMDIFNFSRKLLGKYPDVFQEFVIANRFKKIASNILSKGSFIPLKTSSSYVFAYSRNYNQESIVVVGNLDYKKAHNIVVRLCGINKNSLPLPVKINSIPIITDNKISTNLEPGEVQIIWFKSMKQE